MKSAKNTLHKSLFSHSAFICKTFKTLNLNKLILIWARPLAGHTSRKRGRGLMTRKARILVGNFPLLVQAFPDLTAHIHLHGFLPLNATV